MWINREYPPPQGAIYLGRLQCGLACWRILLLDSITFWYCYNMRRKHRQTLAAVFRHPTSTGIRWDDALALLRACGAEVEERGGSMTAVFLNDEFILLHRPHPGSEIDKGAVASLRRFFEQAGVRPR